MPIAYRTARAERAPVNYGLCVEERWLKVNDDGSGGLTLHDLAAEYGVSAERIRQIGLAAMRRCAGL